MTIHDGEQCAFVRFGASPGSARRRLYCFPFAGGGPATYRLWPDGLADDVEVIVVVAPGRDPRQRAPGAVVPGSMAELVAAAVDAIADEQVRSRMPFAVFGHSMGSLIAYETTLELERRAPHGSVDGEAPGHLFVSGRRPPDEVHTGPQIHELPDDEFVDAMQRNFGGIPDMVRNEPELLAMFLPGLRADVQVYETYAQLTDRRVQCPLRVFGGDDDRGTRPDLLPGWQRAASSEISVRTFPGGHFYLDAVRADLTADVMQNWTRSASAPTTQQSAPTAW